MTVSLKLQKKFILAKVYGRNAGYRRVWRVEADFRLWQLEHKLETWVRDECAVCTNTFL